MIAEPGIEPRLAVKETAELPLLNSAIFPAVALLRGFTKGGDKQQHPAMPNRALLLRV